jgi:hypothetical protein
MNTRMGRLGFWAGMLVLWLSAGMSIGGEASDSAAAFEARDAEIMLVLDRYMDALNDLDLEGHVATYHFPHYRHASGKIVVWQSAREAIPGLDVPEAERRALLRGVLEPDWQRSEWTRRDIVQGDAEKVHVVTRFVRLRADGSVIKTFDSLYVMTCESGRWAIKGRSSFAP